ncbi:response regulator [Robertmurraya sp. DFI.2.37]|uniref:response regulator n=1 Tax=Robertmurraya sp. DFI.2.37 TaxID=3031819 RepID=UPI001245A335|nr:response regulator [Robertmurraya sp. DFI.2.37]MDF1510887.1 response regulator [Robertmurraya sp. DFI.2.37]
MIKLLIVDDEQIEREGMQAILQKAYPNLKIEQARNGKMAVQMTEDFCPDLILMDIKMPGMSGLEAVAFIQKKHENVKFIMVTAYDMFEYLREAIKLGVKDYLLKPSKASEILQTVGKVLQQIEEEKKLAEERKQKQQEYQKALALVETDVVTQLLFDHVHEVHLDMLVEMLDIKSTNEMFVMCLLLPHDKDNLYPLIKKKLRKLGGCWVGALYGTQLPIIVFRDPTKTFRSQAIYLARELLSVRKLEHEEWFIGIGSVVSSLEEIRQSYHDSLIATSETKFSHKYRFYSDVPTVARNEKSIMALREKEFFDQIRLGEWDKVQANVMGFIQMYEKEGSPIVHTQQRVMEVLWLISRIMSEIGIQAITPLYSFKIQDYRQLRAEVNLLLEKMKQTHADHYDQFEADTIRQLKQYIMDNSHKDISLESLGKKVGLSPIYISKMFKEKLGINYIDFLTECRIEKAKILMCDPKKSIKEITYEVGYHEPNYFSKVFKKVCKVSPKDYRKNLFAANN